MKQRHWAYRALFCLIVWSPHSWSLAQTISVSLPQQSVEGKPLYWDESVVALLLRDGQYITFPPSDAKNFRQVSNGFQSYPQSMVRGQLLREFGRDFDVSGTGQYLVVHPAGQRDRWAQRFEQLYRSMVHYFTARGFSVHRPEFPLIAVVFANEKDYLRYLRENKVDIGARSLGYYDPVTNRIQMYDVTADEPRAGRWHINAETIIHEAAHQTAYNIGIHPRFSMTPTWIVEGIGTMFESPGVWDALNHRDQEERVHQPLLHTYRQLVSPNRSLALLKMQLESDDLFPRNPKLAYAHAWALTFYLTEREPRRFSQYLRRLQNRKPLQPYGRQERVQDFVATFGSDLRMFDAHLQRFLETL
jgi:hypothetical protein